MNGGCRFALQALRKFLNQVRILAKSKILWNRGRILLCSWSGEELFFTFKVDMELLKDSIWTELSCNARGLKRPGSIQPGCPNYYNSEVLFYDGTEPEICYPGVGLGESRENF